MSIYVISDLHGCKDEFDLMLKQIRFSEYDEMWIIGDVCDRGRRPIELLREIMRCPNMHLIFGNHDVWLAKYAQKLIDAKKDPSVLDLSDIDLFTWLYFNGGFITADAFMEQSFPDCYDMKLYLEDPVYYKELSVMGRKFLLVHAGLEKHRRADTRLSTVPPDELLWTHIGLNDNPFPDVTMITGHVPTFLYGKEYDGKIIRGGSADIYHIDCGCVFGRTLGCLRLNDMREFYVPSSYPRAEEK